MGVPRKVIRIAVGPDGESPGRVYPYVFALADDGTLWWADPPYQTWGQVAGLPDAEACGIKHREEDRAACRLVKGHRDQHWSGERRWT